MSDLINAWRRIADSASGREQLTMSRSTLRQLLDELEADRPIPADTVEQAISTWVFDADHFRPPGSPMHLDTRLDANARCSLTSAIVAALEAAR